MTVTDMRDGTVTTSTVASDNSGSKAAVKAATTANITLSGAQTIDGVSVVTGDRVLVKNQSSDSENGIYDVNSDGAWSRSPDFDSVDEMVGGTLVPIAPGGSIYGRTIFQVLTVPVILETDTISFAEHGGTSDSSPVSDDGAALGSVSLEWSDLFLAPGGVINWNNGDVTITHSANTLTWAGASSGYNFDAAIKISGSAVYYAGGTDVAVADGGTGKSTLTQHGVVIGNGTSAVNVTGTGSSGQILTSNGASADPTFQDVSIILSAASQADQETATSIANYVTPGRQQYHPGHPKVWAYVTVSAGTPTLQTSYNLTSITDGGVGIITFTIATDFSTANWAAIAMSRNQTAATSTVHESSTSGKAAGTVVIDCVDGSSTNIDPAGYDFVGLGDQP